MGPLRNSSLGTNSVLPQPSKHLSGARKLVQPNSKDVTLEDEIDCDQIFVLSDTQDLIKNTQNSITQGLIQTRNSQSELQQHAQSQIEAVLNVDHSQVQQLKMAKTTQAHSSALPNFKTELLGHG